MSFLNWHLNVKSPPQNPVKCSNEMYYVALWCHSCRILALTETSCSNVSGSSLVISCLFIHLFVDFKSFNCLDGRCCQKTKLFCVLWITVNCHIPEMTLILQFGLHQTNRAARARLMRKCLDNRVIIKCKTGAQRCIWSHVSLSLHVRCCVFVSCCLRERWLQSNI